MLIRHAIAFLAVFLILTRCELSHSEANLTPLKYAYGQQWVGATKNAVSLYPILQRDDYRVWNNDRVFTFYSTTQYENDKRQHDRKIYVFLSVKKIAGQVIADVIIDNKGGENIYVHTANFPEKSSGENMCMDAFQITSYDISMDYKGDHCRLGAFEDKNSWIKILAHSRYAYKVVLDHIYYFMPGTRTYKIGTLEYSITDESWFMQQKSMSSFFSITEDICRCQYVNKASPYTVSVGHATLTINEFIERYLPPGDNGWLQLRSNEVTTIIEI